MAISGGRAGRAARIWAVVAVLLSALVASAHAAPLNLTVQDPDITVIGATVAYDAATDVFTTTAPPGAFSATNAGGAAVAITAGTGSYSLSASIDGAGALAGGTLTIMGDIGSGTETLLAGTIFAFGFDGGGPVGIFEFLLNVTSSAASLGFGSTAGVIVSSDSLLPGLDFTADFRGTANVDSFGVPEPSSLALLALGAAVVAALRRSRA